MAVSFGQWKKKSKKKNSIEIDGKSMELHEKCILVRHMSKVWIVGDRNVMEN